MSGSRSVTICRTPSALMIGKLTVPGRASSTYKIARRPDEMIQLADEQPV
jgi:hypothetical protein